jgi:hypothetical protein
VIVGVEHDELTQAQVACKRPGLRRDALLQVAVAGKNERVMIDDRISRPVEARCEGRFGDRHADGVGQALSKRSGRRLHAGSLAELRMARRQASPFAKAAKLCERQSEPGDVQQRIQERAPVPGRKNESIAVRPMRIVRVESERAIPKRVRH